MDTGTSIFLAALLFMAIALMVTGYMFKRPALAIGASEAWLLTGLMSYTYSTTPVGGPWDIYYGLFWFSMALIIMSAFEAFMVRENEEPPQQATDLDTYADDMERRRSQLDRMRGLRRINPPARKEK